MEIFVPTIASNQPTFRTQHSNAKYPKAFDGSAVSLRAAPRWGNPPQPARLENLQMTRPIL